MSSCLELCDVNDDVLELVVKFGDIEDVVSKERISTRFQNAVSERLSTMTEINTKTDFFECYDSYNKQVMNLLRRMPSLVDASEFGNWGDEMVIELASFNQSIDRIKPNKSVYYDDKMIALYIETVKRINPNYDANQVKCVFQIRFDADGNDDDDDDDERVIRELYQKYPVLNLKLDLESTDFNQFSEYELNHCFWLSIIEQGPNLLSVHGFNYSFVQQVSISYYNGMSRDMTIFPNVKKLIILSVSDPLKLEEWKIPVNLTSLSIIAPEGWNSTDATALKLIIDNYSLIKLTLWIFKPYSVYRSFLEMILNSPNTSIQNVDFQKFSIGNGVLRFPTSDPIMKRGLLKEVLIRFKSVRKIMFQEEWIVKHVQYVDMVKEVIREVEELQRNRSITIIFPKPIKMPSVSDFLPLQ